MTSQSKFAYAAGIVDGEGCLSVHKGWYSENMMRKAAKFRHKHYTVLITVRNTDTRLMDWLVANVGGKIYRQRFKEKPHWKTSYRWQLFGQKAQENFLLAILPYLVIKRAQALILLEFIRMNGEENVLKRESMWQQTRLLNRRGFSPETNMPNTPEGVKIESELAGDCKNEPLVTAVAS